MIVRKHKQAKVDMAQVEASLFASLSCEFGDIGCAKPIVGKLIDSGVLRPTDARNYAMRVEYRQLISAHGGTPDKAVMSLSVKYDLDPSVVRKKVRK